MFGIGLSELLVICCVILIFVRPKDLPKLFRHFGRLYSRLRAYYQELVSVPEQFLKDLQPDVDAEAAHPAAAASPPAADAATPYERVFPEPEARGEGGAADKTESRSDV